MYRFVDLHSATGRRVPRPLPVRAAEPNSSDTTFIYPGEPVQVSVDEVRQRIVWIVSAQGNFEEPQGLPSAISFAESAQELLALLLTSGWTHFSLPSGLMGMRGVDGRCGAPGEIFESRPAVFFRDSVVLSAA